LPEAGPVVTLNPQVAYAFNHWYREEGVALPGEVQTQSAFFARLVETGRLRFKVSSRAAVLQDSAYQARYLEDSKTPRLALGAAFSDLREAVPSGAEANPAAPEGLAPELSPQVKGRMPNRRLRELLETGARQIVTLDPYSYHALVQAAGDGVSCLDLTQALAALVEHP
jgi:Fe-S oxidoreductase